MTETFTDVLIRIYGRQPGQPCYRVEATLSDGSIFSNGQLALDPAALAGSESPQDYGQQLFEALFAGPMREAYDQAMGMARAQSEGDLRLRLWIDPEAAELHALPWEKLYLPGQEQWIPLSATDYTPFSRYLGLELAQARPLTAYPFKVLVAVANPINLANQYKLAPIGAEKELRALHEVLVGLPYLAKGLSVIVMPGSGPLSGDFHEVMAQSGYHVMPGPTSLEALLHHLDGCHLLHFVGHGFFQRPSGAAGAGRAALLLEDSSGRAQVVWDNTLLNRVRALKRPPYLIFLGACESARRDGGVDRENAYVGLAPKLVQVGVPAVIAMQDKIAVGAARDLANNFYLQLGQHGLVDLALNQARRALLDTYPEDWHVPVLFMRLETGQLLATNPVRAALEAIHQHHEAFFSPVHGRYFSLPIEVVYLTPQQLALCRSRYMMNTTARLDLLETVLHCFSRVDTETDPETLPNLLVLVGGYGSNRSTQLKRIAWETAKASLQSEAENPVIPVYIDVKEYSKIRSTFGNPIETLILERIRQFWPDLNAKTVDDLVQSGIRLRLLIDGSEHLPERERYTAWEFIRAFMFNHPRQDYMVVTDLDALQSPRFDKSHLNLHTIVIQPLNERKIRHFLQRRIAPSPQTDDPRLRLLADLDQSQLFDLVATPWFLVNIIERADKGDLPGSRTNVLKRMVEEAILSVPPDYGMRAHTEATIYRLAWDMQSVGASTWSIDAFFEMMVEIRGNRGYNLEDFYAALLRSGLLASVGEHAVRFTYAPIQAYCCAQAITGLPGDQRTRALDDITATLGRISRLRRWEETLVFLSGLLAQDPEALEELLWLIIYGVNLFEGEQTFLAARCLLESKQYLASKQLKPALVDLPNQVINALVWRLNCHNEPRESQRIQATQLLGQLGYLAAYGYPTVVPYLMQVACEKTRRDSSQRLDYYYSSLRLTAATALQHLANQPDPRPMSESFTSHPELLPLLKFWQQGDAHNIIQQLETAPESIQTIGVLALGDLHAQFENDPDTVERSEEITTCLTDKFFDLENSHSMLWSVTHALSMLNSSLVYRQVILPFIENDSKGEIPFKDTEQRIRWYKRVVYLIGQIRSQEPAAHRFLINRCLKELVDVRLWAGVIDAFGWLGDERYRQTLERIAMGDFSQLAPNYDFSEDDQVEHYLQYRAIAALASIGDLDTLATLRENSANWNSELRQAFYRTSEEIHWRMSQSKMN